MTLHGHAGSCMATTLITDTAKYNKREKKNYIKQKVMLLDFRVWFSGPTIYKSAKEKENVATTLRK